jgi:hypothetical protein
MILLLLPRYPLLDLCLMAMEKHSAERDTWHHVRRIEVGLPRSAQAPNGMGAGKYYISTLALDYRTWFASCSTMGSMHFSTYVVKYVGLYLS